MGKKETKHLAVIPARAGSKGLTRKNMVNLRGIPLVSWTIDAALASSFFDKIVVSTDIPELIEYCRDYISSKIVTLKRPPRLCGDGIPLAPVIIHAVNEIEAEFMTNYTDIWTLQPTSPLRDDEDIIKAYKVYCDSEADSLASVSEERHTIFQRKGKYISRLFIPNDTRQTTHPLYVGNGAIAITKKSVLFQEKDRVGFKPSVYVMNQEHSLDIHTANDLALAEYYLNRRATNESFSYR